ncbi:MAG: class I SAM-dependent methyltransferase [Planctomycetes bacterium]|nr:class I SAM-dependent methyltransferase [Planctomycetota bacterium]
MDSHPESVNGIIIDRDVRRNYNRGSTRTFLDGEFMYEYKKFFQYRSKEETDAIEDARIRDAIDFYQKYHAEFVTVPCPICASERYGPFTMYQNTYPVAKCAHCASLFVNPRPTVAHLNEYYNTAESNLKLNRFYQKREGNEAGVKAVDKRIDICIDLLQAANTVSATVLDIGCNNGSFLRQLRERTLAQPELGTVIFQGVDVNEETIATARSMGDGITYEARPVEAFARHHTDLKFDLIIAVYLVEHLFDPITFVRTLGTLLSDRGYLIFWVNNAGGLDHVALDFNARRGLAHAIFPPVHLNGFDMKNLSLFCHQCGLDFVTLGSTGQYDLDLISIYRENVSADIFRVLADVDERAKGVFQQVVTTLGCSGDMYCVARKPPAFTQ